MSAFAESHELYELCGQQRATSISAVDAAPTNDGKDEKRPVEEASIVEEDVPEDAVNDERPSRQYQIVLLIGAFFMIFQVMGINSVYGVFQEFYTSPETNIKDAEGQDALVSLVGTISYGLTWGGGIFVNPLILRTKNLKYVTLTGTVILSLGIVLASFSTKLWHLYITQSLMYGTGASLLYFPIMTAAPRYFDAHRGAAMGFILSGIGAGGLALAPILHALIARFGVRTALRVLGAWTFVMMVPVACIARQPPGFQARRRGGPGAGERDSKRALFRRATFISQAIGAFLQASGNVVPLYYLTTYSTSVLAYSSSTGSLLLAMSNATNSVARIVMGFMADRVGRQNTLVLSVGLSALAVLALWYDAARARFLSFVVLYSVLAGGYNALLPTTITEVYGVQNYDTVNASIYFFRGIGTVVGPPIAGAILGSHKRGTTVSSGPVTASTDPGLQGRYNELVIYDGMLLIGASVCVAYVRWRDARDKGKWNWLA